MGFRSPLCTCRLNWARITSWGWWDEFDDTFFVKLECQSVVRTCDLQLSKQAALTTAPGPQPFANHININKNFLADIRTVAYYFLHVGPKSQLEAHHQASIVRCLLSRRRPTLWRCGSWIADSFILFYPSRWTFFNMMVTESKWVQHRWARWAHGS